MDDDGVDCMIFNGIDDDGVDAVVVEGKMAEWRKREVLTIVTTM